MIDLNRIYALEMMRKRRIAKSTGYRTEDLILHLDGIHNTRAGDHNSSATVWEDLAGNMDVTLYNATWGEDHAAFTGNVNSYGIGDYWTFTKGTTIEVVFSSASNTKLQALAGWNGNSGYRLGQWIRSTRYVAALSSPASTVQNNTPLPDIAFKYSAFTYHLSSVNGQMETNSLSWITGTSYHKFGLSSWLNDQQANISGVGLLGNIYAVRVYDANLTAEELYAHWLIDKKRFNIPD